LLFCHCNKCRLRDIELGWSQGACSWAGWAWVCQTCRAWEGPTRRPERGTRLTSPPGPGASWQVQPSASGRLVLRARLRHRPWLTSDKPTLNNQQPSNYGHQLDNPHSFHSNHITDHLRLDPLSSCGSVGPSTSSVGMSTWGGLSSSISSVFNSLSASAHRQPGLELESIEDEGGLRFGGE